MPKPLAVCIEKMGSESEKSRYMRCVAVSGRQLGLSLDAQGSVAWKATENVSCELWVSEDDHLILYRPAGAVAVMLDRSGRTLDVPYDKPVVIIDQDEVHVGPVHLRMHVHGEASAIAPPEVFVPGSHSLGAMAKAAAAAAILGALAATGCTGANKSDTRGWNDIDIGKKTPPIQVRNNPPSMAPVRGPGE